MGDCNDLNDYFMDFFVDLFYNPEAIGVEMNASVQCGHSGFQFSIGTFKDSGLICHGDPQIVLDAFTRYMKKLERFPSGLESMRDEFENGLHYEYYRDYVSNRLKDIFDGPFPNDPIGHIRDGPTSNVASSTNGTWSALVPAEFLLRKDEDSHFILRMGSLNTAHIMGGWAHNNSDQMNAVSPTERTVAGLQMVVVGSPPQSKYLRLFQQYYAQPTETNPIVASTELNHIAPAYFGPLKKNHSVACPLFYTVEEREELCVSGQEAVWGTEGLANLERIKKALDPKNLFNCQMCVGFNRTAMMANELQL